MNAIVMLLVLVVNMPWTVNDVPVWQYEEPVIVQESLVFEHRLTPEELDLFERLVSAEAKGEGLDGMIAVANVVLNRVESDKWANSITEVIHQPEQFEPVMTGTINQEATEKAKEAVQLALAGERVVPVEVDCFAHKSIDFSSWSTFYIKLNNHKFWVSN